jgi:hypothetical protein
MVGFLQGGWRPPAGFSKDWKNISGIFQGLEKLTEIFPSLGKTHASVSKPPENRSWTGFWLAGSGGFPTAA